jgi:hypothetical protein
LDRLEVGVIAAHAAASPTASFTSRENNRAARH